MTDILHRRKHMKQTEDQKPDKERTPAPALTIEARENQMIAYADAEAERRILNGKASDSLLLHYLKLGTSKNLLEKEKLENENLLLKAKAASIEQSQRTEEMYANAIKAMQVYTGNGEDEDYED